MPHRWRESARHAPRSRPGGHADAERLAVVQRFCAAIVDELETLATTLTQEVGKPIAVAQ